MILKRKMLEKYLVIFLIIYLAAYFYLFTEKYTLWGSDIFFLHNLSKDLDFDSVFSDDRGYPLGFPLLLRMEIESSGLYPYTLIKIHIGIVYSLLVFFIFLVSYKLFRDKLISLSSSLIVASVYPISTLMTPQYGQAINISVILFLTILILLLTFERTKRLIFLVVVVYIMIVIAITHRPSLIIVGLILVLYILLYTTKNFYFRKQHRTIKIVIALLIILGIIGFGVSIIYDETTVGKYMSRIIITKDKVEREISIPYSLGYFLNTSGWELLPFLLFSGFLLLKRRYEISPAFLASLLVIYVLAVLYIAGIVILGVSISWRASNYSIYLSSILFSLSVVELARNRLNKHHVIILYILTVAALILFTFNVPIQKYLYRAVTGTIPENVRFYMLFRESPIIIGIGIVSITILLGILIYIFLFRNVDLNKNRIKISVIVFFMIGLIFALRLATSLSYFYLLVPEIDEDTYQAFRYLECRLDENAVILSDPITLYLSVQYGFEVKWRYGNYVMKDMLPLYGPTSQGARVAVWARALDKIIRDMDTKKLYKIMNDSNTEYFIVNIRSGKLVDMSKNPPYGGFISSPDILLKFKEKLDSEKNFLLVYSRNDIYIYALVRNYS